MKPETKEEEWAAELRVALDVLGCRRLTFDDGITDDQVDPPEQGKPAALYLDQDWLADFDCGMLPKEESDRIGKALVTIVRVAPLLIAATGNIPSAPKGARVVLLSPAQHRALRELAVTLDQLTTNELRKRKAGTYTTGMSAPWITGMRAKLAELGGSAQNRGAIQQLDAAVAWPRAGRVLFAVTPGLRRALIATLTSTRPFWDGSGRDARHLRWLLRRLETRG